MRTLIDTSNKPLPVILGIAAILAASGITLALTGHVHLAGVAFGLLAPVLPALLGGTKYIMVKESE